MEFQNLTPLPALQFDALDQYDQLFHSVVLRATLAWAPATEAQRATGITHTLAFAAEQTPLVLDDFAYGVPNESSLRAESDLAPYKPKCDVIVLAGAHAPRGVPAPRWLVRVQIKALPQDYVAPDAPEGLNPLQSPTPEQLERWQTQTQILWASSLKQHVLLDKTLQVTGPRQFQRAVLGGYSLSDPVPAVSVPMRYEYAYGGQNKHYADKQNPHTDRPAIWEAEQTNVAGCGYAHPDWLKAAKPKIVPAPQIEEPRNPVTELGKRYTPHGFGVKAKSSQPRLALAGTYDARWKQARWPYLPTDFDFAYWNGAHPDLQIEHLQGDEQVALLNLTPAGEPHIATSAGQAVSFRLPEYTVLLRVKSVAGELAYITPVIDTLIIDCEAKTCVLLYRASFPADETQIAHLQARLHMPGHARPAQAGRLQANAGSINTLAAPTTSTES
jgi:hypothetical protein